jgi:hypothetical protein
MQMANRHGAKFLTAMKENMADPEIFQRNPLLPVDKTENRYEINVLPLWGSDPGKLKA